MLKRTPPKRRRMGLTNYRKRLKLVKSGLPRLVIRRTNRYIIVQAVQSLYGGDRTLVTTVSKELRKLGWRGGLKNTPAAYLTGILAGTRMKALGIERLIADLGLFPKASRLYAVIKGVIDAGVEVPVGEGVLPPEDRIKGTHIRQYFERVSQSPSMKAFTKVDKDVYSRLEEHVEEIKQKILSGVSG
ncbi:MAG: 50S ribosomal protein L18 [Candidatus Terraquivivens tikiterensis]|uniref:Large ribosomal subunit protein uL18 n=1 Tax=Candidatus Terraquivivens tikiterensis TaxID=1980982 RepID=A0A2R7Y5R4_9ARCH|nr:MAG: 50S ribosomal protein L18 [Candidatus Terraquivivens tikiterensis]